jgi:hypothetical protein
VENTNIISSIKISNIHPSINKANQDNEAVDMIELTNFESGSNMFSVVRNLISEATLAQNFISSLFL